MEEILDRICLGKVLRLMAADVAAWHRLAGGGLDPDTQVWNDLPLPWEVISGRPTARGGWSRTCAASTGWTP